MPTLIRPDSQDRKLRYGQNDTALSDAKENTKIYNALVEAEAKGKRYLEYKINAAQCLVVIFTAIGVTVMNCAYGNEY